MFQKRTTLRKLQVILSGKGRKLFDNQVCFYNGIFGITNAELFSEELVEYMEADGNRVRCPQRQEIEEFLRGGLDSSSSNIGKHINDDIGMTIPKYHCIHYAQAEQKKEICRRLAAVIRYGNNRRSGDHGNLTAESEAGMDHVDLQEVFLRLKKELSHASGILAQSEVADEFLLATIIYEIVQTHLGERHNPELPKHETVLGKINMKQQIDEYFLTCDCYEFTSIDFLFALQRMADKNVIASSNLAGFYYVGMEFAVKNEGFGPSGIYVVEKNLEQAAHYFKQSTTSQPPYAPGAYSYGYMILHKETGDMTDEERMKVAEHYYLMAAEQKFHHAVSGLGDLALMRAEKLLETSGPEEQIMKELSTAIGYFDQAEKMGSFWGPIKAAQFLDNSDYEPYLESALKMAGLAHDGDARTRWKRAVAMGNVFAMEQLALLDLRLCEEREAKEMLEQAAQMNYPNASYHLAKYFYHERGLSPDKKKYLRALEKAAHDGSARASVELGKLALIECENVNSEEEKTRQQRHASVWFQRAEEQNFRCFEKDIYEELRKYKRYEYNQ